VVLSTMMTGARLQQPRHATSITVNWLSVVVSSPGFRPSSSRTASSTMPAPDTWQAVPLQTRMMCLPCGLRRNMV